MVGCHRGRLPELLTLCYADTDSLTDDPVALVANDGLHYSDVEAADRQKSNPLSTGMCGCSTNPISAPRQTVIGSSKQEHMQLEASSDDAVTSVCASSTSVVAVAAAAAVAIADDDDDDDDDILCASLDALYNSIRSRLQAVEDVGQRSRLCDSLRILLPFFEIEYFLAETSSSESSPAFPLHLIEQYTMLIKDDVSFYSADG